MSHSKQVFFCLISVLFLSFASCSKNEKQTADEFGKSDQQSGTNKQSNSPPTDELQGVLYPNAVIRFKIGEGISHEVSEGLHFEKSKREKGHLTGVNVDNEEFDLTWKYLGSDENSDDYQVSLKLPGETQASQNKTVEYSGESSVTVYKTDKVSVTIEERMRRSEAD